MINDKKFTKTIYAKWVSPHLRGIYSCAYCSHCGGEIQLQEDYKVCPYCNAIINNNIRKETRADCVRKMSNNELASFLVGFRRLDGARRPFDLKDTLTWLERPASDWMP